VATIVQNIGGNPVSRFLNTFQVIREGDETLEPGSDPSTAALFSRPDSLLPIHLGGDGFTYSSGALATGTVTSFELLTFEGALYSFSGFDGISAANAMAILNGNDALFYNLIQTTQWNYTGSDEADNFFSGGLNDVLSSGSGDDSLFGSGGNDMINGGADNDTLDGGSGNDKIDGGTGIDTMYGGAGNDMFYVSHNSDRVRENAGEGSDTVITANTFTRYYVANAQSP